MRYDLMFPWARQPCPGEGCANSIMAGQEMCAACAQKAEEQKKRSDAEWHKCAEDGLERFKSYLAKWARFEDEYGPN